MIGYGKTELASVGFASRFPFEGKGCGAAAVFCRDGRFADQVNDFLQNGLGLYGYDRLALAGGPGCFAGHFAAYREEEAAVSHLQFLARLHGLERLVLISHEDCGFYRDFLRVRDADLLGRLKSDLIKASRRIALAAPRLRVEAYLARLAATAAATAVWFEPVVA